MEERDLKMVLMWEGGKDTLDIAVAFRLPESDVYNRLPWVRLVRREERGSVSS